MEEALFLTRFASKVYVVHRRDELRASRIMAERAMNDPKIEFVWSGVVEEVLGESKVEGLRVRNVKTGETFVIDCRAVFVALGHVPNTALFKQFIDTDETGYVILNDRSSKTKLGGVFVAGDCADRNYRQAITAAGMAARPALTPSAISSAGTNNPAAALASDIAPKREKRRQNPEAKRRKFPAPGNRSIPGVGVTRP